LPFFPDPQCDRIAYNDITHDIGLRVAPHGASGNEYKHEQCVIHIDQLHGRHLVFVAWPPPGCRMNRWALVLGSSSGIGRASALKLAADGYDIIGVHFDRRAAMPGVVALRDEIERMGRRVVFFNSNLAQSHNRVAILDQLAETMRNPDAAPGHIQVVLHSIAFGVTKPLIGEGSASEDDLTVTCAVMGHDLVHWARGLLERGLLASPGRILSMTSEGDRRAWRSYGPVSAAKCILESHTRQLAVELAGRRITVNCIMAGVTNTPALRVIPGNEGLIAASIRRNPHGRLTTPEDVADVVSLLCDPRAGWITGSVISCDGGESITA
jgi:enoyl-[acyl-carrier protein] reductase III